MFKRNLWKILLSLVLLGWAVATLLPLNDQDFPTYIKTHASAKPAEFAKLLDEAAARQAGGKASSVYVALKQIGSEQQVDLSVYFPDIRLEASLRNIERRNEILLNELLRRSKSSLKLGLDIKGGVAVTLEVDPKAVTGKEDPRERQEKLQKAIEILSVRINGFGVTEPVIRPIGDNRIEVQLPSVNTKDNPEIVENVKKPAQLDFRTVNTLVFPSPGVDTPPGYVIMNLDQEDGTGHNTTERLFVKRIPAMAGKAIANAYWRPDLYGKPEVILQFTAEGKKQFAAITRDIAEEGKQAGRLGRLAIVLDGKLYSAPTVREEIDSNSAQISGSFSEREANDLANVLNNPLDLPLIVKEQYEVGPSLAADAISSGKRATVIGIVLVALFMVGYYSLSGLIAVLSVTLNIVIVLGVLASYGATITMPGIAGIVLTVGMAVDAHILIFERMREELKSGKSLVAAFHAGHEKAFRTIVDANITTLITAGLMIMYGTGPVKGFGLTLTVGIFSTMFTALIVSQMLLDLAISSGLMKRMIVAPEIKVPAFDFVGAGRKAFTISWVIVLIGVVSVAFKGHAVFGIDFAGGDVVNLTFKEKVDTAKLRAALDQARMGEVNPLYRSEIGGDHEILDVQTELGKAATATTVLQQAFPNAGLVEVGKSSIGPSIGAEIQWNAIVAIVLALLGIMIYVAFRFEIGYGMGAVVSTVHDVLMTIGLFVVSGRQFSAPMVGAILLIVGYSINDTIVVFDRIREELKANPLVRLRDVINIATRKVFTRSLLTSLTTFLAALALYLFGGGVINDLAFTFLIGIVTGTFSSIFVAAPVFYWWHKGDRKHVEAHSDVAPKYEWTGSSKASE
ncbi:MAG: protein translocase subunit SecD [Opitutaceae bacterium]|nr:protein translocase subunit SecD [Opitutaceae bacterium]MBP9912091.1 protein translocase subunit SecD [Opitutaceae bacterium]